MIPLTNKEIVCHVFEKKFCDNKNKKSKHDLYHKVRDRCHYTGKFRNAAHNICNLRYKVPKEILIVFHNGSTYDYHFVIKKLAKEFEGQFECLGENTEKYITFSLSNLVDTLSGVYDKECKKCMERKTITVNCEFVGFKNGRLNCKYKECKKSYIKVASESTENFPTLYKFCNDDLNKFFCC